MTFKSGDRVMVEFPQDSGEWTAGVVMSYHRGWVLCHIDRPRQYTALPNMAGPKPIVMVKERYVRAEEAA